MLQSSLLTMKSMGLHVAIIMDGNGRWATARGRVRTVGHREGANAVRRVVEAAPDLGIQTLTLFAFSADNWQRPKGEVSLLMRLFQLYLQAETEKCVRHGIKLNVIGRRDRLPARLLTAIAAAERATVSGNALHLRIAVDYSAREAILRAAAYAEREVSRERFSQLLAEVNHTSSDVADVDLLIRTGGEQRLSDFLLWESAYAELVFTKRMWPDFTAQDLASAVAEFHQRERRFGCIPLLTTG